MIVALTRLMFIILEGRLDWCSELGVAKGRMENEVAVQSRERQTPRTQSGPSDRMGMAIPRHNYTL